MGGYSAGRCGWDDSPPAGDGSDNIPTVSGASDSPGVGVTVWHSVASVTCRAPPADALRVVPPPQLHPLLDRCGATLQIQHSAPTRRRAGRGAGSALPYGSSSSAGGSIWDLPSTDFPGLPGAPSAIRQPCPPAGRASHLESQLMAIRYGLTALPEPLRLPQPTWMPPTTQNRRRVQLPPPLPKTDSVPTTDQSQQTTAPDPGPEGQGTQRPGRARARGRYHGPASPLPRQPHTSQQASGRSGGTSRSEQRRERTGTRWPIFRTTIAGVGKKTWTSTWEPTLGSITGRSQPPSGPN